MLSDLVEYVNVHFDELNKDLIPIDTDAADHGRKRWKVKYVDHSKRIGMK
jgi:hypothetical protein